MACWWKCSSDLIGCFPPPPLPIVLLLLLDQRASQSVEPDASLLLCSRPPLFVFSCLFFFFFLSLFCPLHPISMRKSSALETSPDLLPPTLLRLAFQSVSLFNSCGPPSSLQYDHSLRVTSSLSACPVSAFHISMKGPALSVSLPHLIWLHAFPALLCASGGII